MIFFCIADKESSLGFRLAGIEAREAETRSEALEALEVAKVMQDVGIILITDKVSSLIRKEIDMLAYQNRLPLILEISSKGQTAKHKSTGEFLKEAIGISV